MQLRVFPLIIVIIAFVMHRHSAVLQYFIIMVSLSPLCPRQIPRMLSENWRGEIPDFTEYIRYDFRHEIQVTDQCCKDLARVYFID